MTRPTCSGVREVQKGVEPTRTRDHLHVAEQCREVERPQLELKVVARRQAPGRVADARHRGAVACHSGARLARAVVASERVLCQHTETGEHLALQE